MRLPRFARNDRGELLNKLFKKWTWPIYWAALPDESGNYKKMKVKILSTKYEILNNTKAQMTKIQNKTSFGI